MAGTFHAMINRGLKVPGRTLDLEKALCRKVGHPDEWHVDEYDKEIQTTKAAIKVCHACPIKDECLEYALENKIVEFGVFGGKTAKERRRMLKRGERQ